MSASLTTAEIATQPDCWLRAAQIAPNAAGVLPRRGESVAVIGCGTSWFMAQSYAVLREQAGHGLTDAFAASAYPFGRGYDRVLALTRSGTTTEVLRACTRLRTAGVPVTAVTADPDTPVRQTADDLVVLDFADERSVVQTRFATTALALLRAHLGDDLTGAVADARTAVSADLPAALPVAEQTTFLGTGWTYGLAQEAALKMREAAGAWTESYPAMEYRHGPISITGPGRAVWAFGGLPDGLAEAVAATGGTLEARQDLDPLADLIRAQRLAVEVAGRRGLDPDSPRHLTRSVVLG
ncbi:SIS domain-containing protein [Streptomyces sp. NRRL F-5123]|uniref:SIS domain-containing protein n=1 Tax=Streptomyces sp. NRRL F-5123 TaxID=1463856 RepID=UPI0004E0D298|nr:sugar isomerase [Streptomyces sp. NRRL F-5123]